MSLTHLLSEADHPLELVGGKARSLSRLIDTGHTVPLGFVVTTEAYRSFVAENNILETILTTARPRIVDGRVSFEQASDEIGVLFNSHELSQAIREALTAAISDLPSGSGVAVRSSANAEDLPELSFAGQQETYLNVVGTEAILEAIRNCWASLWTAQALGYRHEMDISSDSVAMAVVVQLMIPAESAGIVFTANPATGERDEIIVNASLGLGEAVVSGEVTSDAFTIDRHSRDITDRVIGSKEIQIVSNATNGTETQQVDRQAQQAASISDPQLMELVETALAIESRFENQPQDIEWAIAEDKLWILQSRPITNLPEPPPRDVTWPEISGAQLLKRQVAENMPDPLSPLFEDMYLKAIFDTQKWPAGWQWQGRLTKNYMKNFVVTTVNGYAYQPIYHDSAKDWKGYMKDHRSQQQRDPWYVNVRKALTMGEYMIEDMKGSRLHFLYVLVRLYRTFQRYPALLIWEEKQLPAYLEVINRWQKLDPGSATGEEILMAMRELSLAEARYWHALRSVIGTAKGTDGAFQHFLEEHAPDVGLISGTFLSGFKSKTLEAEMAMRAIADLLRNSPELRELTLLTPASRLLGAIDEHPTGGETASAIRQYLYEYGRQVFNLDFVEPSLYEAPTPFAVNLKALVRDPGYDLDQRLKDVRRTRRQKFRQALGFFKGRTRLEFLRLYFTARVNYPTREEALFYMGLSWSVFRPWALELGRRLTDEGTFGSPDDVFYVTSNALENAVKARVNHEVLPELADQALEQKKLRTQRFRMQQPAAIPPIKNDKSTHATQRNNDDADDRLRGFAVSPGIVTGIASVVMSPEEFDRMQPDSILVCPLTTPAWTQLFPHARGLVTDIGSILAHGSIVAREYGIPAVLGIGDATQRIRHGQRIEINGDRGTVTLLD